MRAMQDGFPRLADRLTIAYAALFAGAALLVAALTEGVVVSANGLIGSDFLAFYTAGEFAAAGHALAAYDQAAFDAALKARAPLEHLGLMWQYPPTMFFIVAPLTLLPYKVSYFLWLAAGWATLALALRHIGFRGRGLRLLVLSPLAVGVIVSGQISLFTGALLALAAYDPKNRWLTAGVAAGLLTIKPQLGLLLPLAYVATGAWRTVAAAAATAALVHAPSLFVFGAEGWSDFLAAVVRLNADVTGAAHNTPPEGMTTLFGQLRVLGVPSSAAVPAQYGFAAAAAAAVFLVWRSGAEPLAKAAALCAGAILASPYAYAYEMTALILPAAFLARQGETRALVAGWTVLALWPLLPERFFLQAPFLLSIACFALTLLRRRRANGPEPHGGGRLSAL